MKEESEGQIKQYEKPKKKRKRVTANASKYLHQVSMKMPKGKRMKVSVTPEGNRFSLMLISERMKEVLDNQLRLWQAEKDKPINVEDLYRFSVTMREVANISYRAHGDTKETPDLPRMSTSQKALLKEAIPEAWAMIEASEKQEGVFKNVNTLDFLDTIDVEAEEKGLDDENVEEVLEGDGGKGAGNEPKGKEEVKEWSVEDINIEIQEDE